MTGMRRTTAIAVFVLVWVGMPPRVLACSCVGPVPFPEALAKAHTAFVGEVLDVRYKASLPLRAAMRVREIWAVVTGFGDAGLREWYQSPLYGRAAELRVIESFKGDGGTTVTVHYGACDDCMSYPFVVGEKYIVFAYETNERAPDGSKRLEVNSCGMTRPLAEAQAAVGELRVSGQGGSQ